HFHDQYGSLWVRIRVIPGCARNHCQVWFRFGEVAKIQRHLRPGKETVTSDTSQCVTDERHTSRMGTSHWTHLYYPPFYELDVLSFKKACLGHFVVLVAGPLMDLGRIEQSHRDSLPTLMHSTLDCTKNALPFTRSETTKTNSLPQSSLPYECH